MKRFIEDLVLFSFVTLIFLSPFVIVFTIIALFYCLSLPIALLIVLSYGSWMYFDRYTPVRGGRTSNYLRQSSIWTLVSNYFPINLVKTADIEPDRNYIFGCHPHGRLTIGAINFLTEATHFSTLFPSIRPHLMTLPLNFLVPFFRELHLNLGIDQIRSLLSNVLSFQVHAVLHEKVANIS